jgi:long-chain acyl-CoA synthetase
VLAATAFTHPYGLTVGLLAGTLAAATLVVPVSTEGPALVRTIADARPTLFPALPSLLVAIVEAGGRRRPDLSSLRVCLVGGAPLAPDVARRYRALSGEGRLREGYGVSEAGPLTHANPVYGRAHHGRGGLPVTGTASIVVDPDDPTVVLDPGQVGLLAVTGPQVMPGYWQDPEGTAAVLRDGWLLTGDLAVMDTAGHVGIVDRLVDVVVTAAGAVFPADVEQVLRLHPVVQDVRVTGRGTTAGIDEVVAHVMVTGDAAGATDQLVVHCRAHLPSHAVPVDIEVVRALPEGRTAAVVRRRLHPRPTDQEVAP